MEFNAFQANSSNYDAPASSAMPEAELYDRNSGKIALPILGDEKFSSAWLSRLWLITMSNGCIDILKSNTFSPRTDSLYTAMRVAINIPNIESQLASYKTPHDLYKFLVLRNDENLKSSIEELYDNLCTFKIMSAFTIREDLDKFLSLLCRVKSAQGEWNISDSQAQLHMLRVLPLEIRSLRGAWSILDCNGPNGLRDHLVRQAKIYLEANPQFAAETFRKSQQNKKESKDSKDKACSHCKKKGHTIDKCFAYKESKGETTDLPAWYLNRKNNLIGQQKKSPWSAMAKA